MKHTLLLLSGLVTASPAFAQTAIIEYSFNDSGTTTASTGSSITTLTLFAANGTTATDYHGAAGSGVSGLASDRALDFSSAAGMGSASGASGGPIARHGADLDAIDGLRSLTLQGWFKTEAAASISGSARLFKNNETGNGFALLASGSSGNLQITLGNGTATNFTTTTNSYSAAQSWVFFAVTFDGTVATNNVKFYVGSTSQSVSLVQTFSYGAGGPGNPGSIANDSQNLRIGNEDPSFQRPFDGLLDNIRIFGGKASASDASGALSLAQLEAIRAADATPIPEPSAFAALAGLGALGLVATRRRR